MTFLERILFKSPRLSNWLIGKLIAEELRAYGVNHFVVYDIGARWGIWEPFHCLPLPLVKVGFEPEPQEAEKLEKSGVFDTVCPVGLSGDGGDKTLHIAKNLGASSIYGPDLDSIARFCDPGIFEVQKEICISTFTLGSAVKKFQLQAPDFIKLDVEGAELEIMKGGEEAIRNASGILFESRLSRFYNAEPVHGEIVEYLQKLGFMQIAFNPVGSFSGAHMLIDAGMARNLRVEENPVRLLKSAAFSLIVGNMEYAINLLRAVKHRTGLRSKTGLLVSKLFPKS